MNSLALLAPSPAPSAAPPAGASPPTAPDPPGGVGERPFQSALDEHWARTATAEGQQREATAASRGAVTAGHRRQQGADRQQPAGQPQAEGAPAAPVDRSPTAAAASCTTPDADVSSGGPGGAAAAPSGSGAPIAGGAHAPAVGALPDVRSNALASGTGTQDGGVALAATGEERSAGTMGKRAASDVVPNAPARNPAALEESESADRVLAAPAVAPVRAPAGARTAGPTDGATAMAQATDGPGARPAVASRAAASTAASTGGSLPAGEAIEAAGRPATAGPATATAGPATATGELHAAPARPAPNAVGASASARPGSGVARSSSRSAAGTVSASALAGDEHAAAADAASAGTAKTAASATHAGAGGQGALASAGLASSSAEQSDPAVTPGAQWQGLATGTAGTDANPVLATGVGMQDMIDSIRATIQLAARQGLAQARIALQPQDLGHISIRLSQTSGGLLARVSAETPAAVQALTDARSELHQSLSSLGVSLLRLDINSFGQPQAGGQEQRAGSEAQPGAGAGASGASAKPHETDESVAPGAIEAAPAQAAIAGGELVDVLA